MTRHHEGGMSTGPAHTTHRVSSSSAIFRVLSAIAAYYVWHFSADSLGGLDT